MTKNRDIYGESAEEFAHRTLGDRSYVFLTKEEHELLHAHREKKAAAEQREREKTARMNRIASLEAELAKLKGE